MSEPIHRFKQWLDEAKGVKTIAEPTAMTLATADSKGRPSARIVLLKDVDERGFVFYTNLESRKSGEIKQNHHAALCFHWMPLEKQVRVEGVIEPVSDEEADAYFATRARASQIGAWSSQQSRDLESREQLVQAVADHTKKFEGKPVPRPPFWSGWRLMPQVMEFWQQGESRLHERDVYTRGAHGWATKKIWP